MDAATRYTLMREDVSLVLAREYGDTRTSATILAALLAIGSQQCVLVLNDDEAGPWVLETDITIPANVTLSIPAGVSVTGTANLTILGGLLALRVGWFQSSGVLLWLAGAGEWQTTRLRSGVTQLGSLGLDAPLALTEGGTEARTAGQARLNLGLEPGVNVQAWDAELAALASQNSAADRLFYFNGPGAGALAVFTPYSRTLLASSDAATWRSLLEITLPPVAPGGLSTQAQWNDAGVIAGSSGLTLSATQVTGIIYASQAAGRNALALGTADTVVFGKINLDNPSATGNALNIGPLGAQMYGTLHLHANVERYNYAGDNQYGYRSWINTAGGTGRYAFYSSGDAPSSLGGTLYMNASVIRWNTTGNDQYGFYSALNAAGGTGRFAFFGIGDAPSQFNGRVDIQGSMLLTGRTSWGTESPWGCKLWVLYNKQTVYGIMMQNAAGAADTGGYPNIYFANAAGSQVGAITTTASATAYGTSSDVRLKHAIAPLGQALAALQRLRPVTFRWNITDDADEGFLAHELQQVMPRAVTGEPDALHDDGTIKPQQVDASKLVVWLVAGLQELTQDVAALKTQLAALA